MSIAINAKQCVGCGKCSMVCPGSLIHMNADGKAFIKYPKDCWGCTSCLKECAVHAIRFYLGADMGGMGSLVHTEKEGERCFTTRSNRPLPDSRLETTI